MMIRSESRVNFYSSVVLLVLLVVDTPLLLVFTGRGDEVVLLPVLQLELVVLLVLLLVLVFVVLLLLKLLLKLLKLLL